MTEWTIVPDSKSGVPHGTGGSNPSLSALRRGFVRQAGLEASLFELRPAGRACLLTCQAKLKERSLKAWRREMPDTVVRQAGLLGVCPITSIFLGFRPLFIFSSLIKCFIITQSIVSTSGSPFNNFVSTLSY